MQQDRSRVGIPAGHSILNLIFLAALVLATVSVLLPATGSAQDQDTGSEPATTSNRQAVPGRTGLPLPRFVTLRAAEVNLRSGPGTVYPIEWVYRRRGMPVEIIDEFGNWRRIRDWQDTEGWVHRSMLRGRRGALSIDEKQLLRRRPDSQAPGVVWVEPGVVMELLRCQSDWCAFRVQGFEGWLRRDAFYGLYPDEDPG